MAMMFLAALVAVASIASALFGGVVNHSAVMADAMSLALALVTGVAIAGAVALDG